jgi:hypothetical protein
MRRFLRRLFRRGPESSPSSTKDGATFASTESRHERESVLELSAEASGGDSMRTILFLAANPNSMATLDLDSERRAIELSLHLRDPARMIQENAVMAEQFAIKECMQRAPGQHTLRVVAESAVTDDDLRRALLKHEPDIVHFSGHGGTGFRRGRGAAIYLRGCIGRTPCPVFEARELCCAKRLLFRSAGAVHQFRGGLRHRHEPSNRRYSRDQVLRGVL